MKMRFGLLVLVTLFCFGTSDVLGYPYSCAPDNSGGTCEGAVDSGSHICPDCGRHVVPGGISHKMVPASQCWRPECVAARQSSGSSSDNGGSTYDPYEAQRLAAEAEAEHLRQEALREAARKKKLREVAAKTRKTWDKNDAETMRQMESMFASSSKKKISKLKCDCNNGWRDCEWCENGTRDCTRYGCRGGTENCGCVRPGVGPKADCTDCKGSGLIQCTVCKGKGTMPCNWCENGKVRCWACGHDFRIPVEPEVFTPQPDPLVEAREQALDKMIHVDASLLSVDQKQRLATARAAYLKSIAPPATSAAMQKAEKAVFDRDRELFTQLLAKRGGKLPSDPTAKAAFMRELQAAMESDPERQLLLNKQIHQDLVEAAKGNTALAQAIQAAGGAAVLVPSFNAKVMPLPKTNLRDQVSGSLGAYVPEHLSRKQLKERFDVLEEYAIEKDAKRIEHEQKSQYYHRKKLQMLAPYEKERAAFEKQQGGWASEDDFIQHLWGKYRDDPAHNVDLLREYHKAVWEHSYYSSDYADIRDAAHKEWKRLLDDQPGAARVAVEVNRKSKADELRWLERQIVQTCKRVEDDELKERQKQESRRIEYETVSEAMRPTCRSFYEDLPAKRKARQDFDSYLHVTVMDTINPDDKYWPEWSIEDMLDVDFDAPTRQDLAILQSNYRRLKKYGTPLQNPVEKPEYTGSEYELYDLFPLNGYKWKWSKEPNRKKEAGQAGRLFGP